MERAVSGSLRSGACVWGAALWEGREAGPKLSAGGPRLPCRGRRRARAQRGCPAADAVPMRRTRGGAPGARGRGAGPRALPRVGDPSSSGTQPRPEAGCPRHLRVRLPARGLEEGGGPSPGRPKSGPPHLLGAAPRVVICLMRSARPDAVGGKDPAGRHPNLMCQKRAPWGAGPTPGVTAAPAAPKPRSHPPLKVREPGTPSQRLQRLQNVLEDSGNVLGKQERFNGALLCQTCLRESSPRNTIVTTNQHLRSPFLGPGAAHTHGPGWLGSPPGLGQKSK